MRLKADKQKETSNPEKTIETQIRWQKNSFFRGLAIVCVCTSVFVFKRFCACELCVVIGSAR